MTKQDDMEFLVGRERHERAVALLTTDPALWLVHERFADGYAKQIAELRDQLAVPCTAPNGSSIPILV